MTNQPEALYLADELDAEFAQGRISNHNGRKAAVKLRRLHALNQELLEALKKIARTEYHIETPPIESLEEQMRSKARAAIAKAEGEN